MPTADVAALMQGQHSYARSALRKLSLRKLRAEAPRPAWSPGLEAQMLQAEAGIRWLDHVGQMYQTNGRGLLPFSGA